jgi:hypothetical protein
LTRHSFYLEHASKPHAIVLELAREMPILLQRPGKHSQPKGKKRVETKELTNKRKQKNNIDP